MDLALDLLDWMLAITLQLGILAILADWLGAIKS